MNTEAIWETYHDRLHGFIQKRVGNAAVADDILQDVFVRIHSRLEMLKDARKIQSWIYQIARNAVIDSEFRGRHQYRSARQLLWVV